MFFFFIGGIQPRTVTLDEAPRMCPLCGLNRARLKGIDHYISLFFIPLFRIKKGEPFLECPSCGPVVMRDDDGFKLDKMGVLVCPHCGREILSGYRFCPFCGKKIEGFS